MATFLKANDDGGAEEKIVIDSNEVEKGILKQLFYKVDPSKISE